MNPKILLSICIPTYNRANEIILSLKLLVLGISEKIIPLIEIVIRDNGSTDSTPKVIYDFVKKNSSININYIRTETNEGYDNNIHQLYSIAKGEYIWFLGDRYMLQIKLERIVDILQKYSPSYIGFTDIFTMCKRRVSNLDFKKYNDFFESFDSCLDVYVCDISKLLFKEVVPMFSSLPAVIFERNIDKEGLEKIKEKYYESQFMHIPLAIESIMLSKTKAVCICNVEGRSWYSIAIHNAFRFDTYLTTKGMKDIYNAYPLLGAYNENEVFYFFFSGLKGYMLGKSYIGVKNYSEVCEKLNKLNIKINFLQYLLLFRWRFPSRWFYRILYLLRFSLRNVTRKDKINIMKTVKEMREFDSKIKDFDDIR